ncbi:MAG: VPLPA-CTERM sorting domain-containing protein [Rhodobacteraceae bacterium]|nr:VPLPA-CTERM sorting domain-containing protein [Paracoccaceae bacterium]MCF8514885.1 VPLPA-CTERM sorting domain-containing protein [Paracoccaceae bacterium]MCF8519129.1 VPLPA-CTERM sorting domain-containing protein [Paracoccaceae bacterium]
MLKKLLLSGALAGFAAHANASVITVNFDSLPDFANINGVDLGGVTVTNPSGHVDVFANRFGVGARSGLNAIGSFTASSSNNPMIFTFASAVSWVELFAGDAGSLTGDLDQWRMDVYDAATGGTLLASLLSPIWIGGPYEGLSFAGAGIRRIEAIWTEPGCCGLGFDDLSFETTAAPPPPPMPAVPLPASGTLLAGVLGVFAAMRRKKRS